MIEKVYFTLCCFDEKLQTDNLVRWDVAARLNRKHKRQQVKNHGIQVYSRRMG